jgi:N-methylhydantoinase A
VGATADGGKARKGARRAWFPGAGFTATPVYDRPLLAAGTEIDGPALLEEEGSTLVVPPDTHLRVAASGNIILTLDRRSPA